MLGFHCCRLYSNEPTDILSTLKLGLAYVFSPRFMMGVSGSDRDYEFKTWAEVLSLPYAQATARSISSRVRYSRGRSSAFVGRRGIALRFRGFALPCSRG